MIRSVAVAMVASRLGNRTDLDASILLEMDNVQRLQLEEAGSFTPWFLETTPQDLVTVAGQDYLALPADFIMEIEDEPMWLYFAGESPEYVRLPKEDHAIMLERYPTSAQPKYVSLRGERLLFTPTPDAVYNIKWSYYAHDALPSVADVENKWLKYASDLLIAQTTAVMARGYLQNPKQAQEQEVLASVAWKRLHVMHEARQHAARSYSMGED